MDILYHEYQTMSRNIFQGVEPFSSYKGVVRKWTPTGCIVELSLEGEKKAMCYIYASFNVGDKLIVGITKVFENEDKYPRGVCEQVIEYARDSNVA